MNDVTFEDTRFTFFMLPSAWKSIINDVWGIYFIFSTSGFETCITVGTALVILPCLVYSFRGGGGACGCRDAKHISNHRFWGAILKKGSDAIIFWFTGLADTIELRTRDPRSMYLNQQLVGTVCKSGPVVYTGRVQLQRVRRHIRGLRREHQRPRLA